MIKFLGIIIFSSSVFFQLHAKLEDHFKKVGVKPSNHKMENVDFIYMLNLDQRPEKFQNSLDQLLPYGINPYRFSAVNGWELSLDAILDVGVQFGPGMFDGFMATTYEYDHNGSIVKLDELIQHYGRTYYCYGTSRGCIGIALSHLSILQDAYDSGYETVWIMEDDIKVIRDPREVSKLIKLLDEEVGTTWDVLFTDLDVRGVNGDYVPSYGYAKRPDFHTNELDRFFDRPQIGEHFRKIGSRFGAHSMICRRSGMAKILDFMKEHHIYLPYDMDYCLPPQIEMYTVLDDVVGNIPNGLTDNAYPGYLEKKGESLE
jgi:GR25 family glycosyltransferase involved in LPS biosynthesis